VEPAAVAFHAVELTPVELGDSAVIVGAGIIGLFIIQTLKLKGCGAVYAVDLDQDRLQLATELGADVVLDAEKNVADIIKNKTHNRGADLAFEAVGIETTISTAINSVRRGATVTLVGNLSPQVSLPLQSVVTQQLRLQGSCAIAGEYPAVLRMIENGRINVDPMLTAAAPLSEGAEWFKRIYNKEPGIMKVVLNP